MRILFLILILFPFSIQGQESNQFESPLELFLNGQELYNKSVFAPAKERFDELVYQLENEKHFRDESIYQDAQLLSLLCGLHLEIEGAEFELKNFVDALYPDARSKKGVFELGNYYYNQKSYSEAIYYFDKMEAFHLNQDERSEINFKKGYCLFVNKRFSEAERVLLRSINTKNKYYYPTNYYYGMCQYFSQDYKGAIVSFERVSSAAKYKGQIPYYISQIHFAEGNYDQLLSYAERKIKDPAVEKIPQIRLLLGQAYFKKGNFEKSLEHLEFYEANTQKLTKEEFYQLAFTQYQLKKYEKAKESFLELTSLDSKMGQVSNYYLADCYLKLNDKNSATAAFRKVSKMSFDNEMQAEANFNYGKLSAELGKDREAINCLSNISSNSDYYRQSQVILSDIFIHSQDYVNSIKYLKKIDPLSPELSKTFKRISFYKGLQDYNDQQPEDALKYFELSNSHIGDKEIEIQSRFWIATIYNQLGRYNESEAAFDYYFSLTHNINELPSGSEKHMAYYIQAYNYYEREKYGPAAVFFKKSLSEIEGNKDKISDSEMMTKVYPDGLTRTGDCYFMNKEYDDALSYYYKSIDKKSKQADYALFQKSNIEGIKRNYFDQILSLEQLVDEYPDSKYGDQAYFNLGETYNLLGKEDQAFFAFQNIPQKYRSSSPLLNKAYLRMGLISYNRGDAELSIEYYKRVFEYSPTANESNEAMLALEEIYVNDLGQSKDYFEFVEAQPGLKVSGFSKDSLSYRQAEIQFENGEYQKAIGNFTQYLNEYKDGYFKLEAYQRRGECYSILQRYSEALRDYEILMSEGFSPFYASSVKKCAVISYNHEQDFNKALKYYKLMEEHSNNSEDKFEASFGALRSAFRVQSFNDVYKYGELVINDSLAVREDIASAHYYRGKAFNNQKRFDEAIKDLNQVVRLSQNNQAAESSYLLSQLFFSKGMYDQAETQCETTNKTSANYPFWIAKSILLLSDIYVIKEDIFNARAAVEAVLENFSDNQDLTKEANEKLAAIKEMESISNRIKDEENDQIIELDNGGNEE